MNSRYALDLEAVSDDEHYPSVTAAVEYAQRIIDGTDKDAGIRLGKKVFEIISARRKLTHPLIIFGNRISVPLDERGAVPHKDGFNIRARDSLFNRGLLEGLGINDIYEPSSFIGYSKYSILGREVTTEPLFNPATDLTQVEEDGLLRRMRVITPGENGEEVTKLPCGFRVIPQFALRVTFPGMVEEV